MGGRGRGESKGKNYVKGEKKAEIKEEEEGENK